MRIEIESDCELTTADGVVLRADVYRPAGASGLPTLLQRTPYDKTQAVRSDVDVLRLVRAGYAVVVQDVRGRYASAGVFEPFRHEAADGAETIAWAAAQPWSSGAVGMFGASYVGIVQWLAASAQPPALRAIAPFLTSPDPYDGWAYQGGAFELGFALQWHAASLATEPLADDPRDRFDASASRRPLAGHPGLAPFHADWLAHPARDAWWEQLAPRERIAGVTVPALSIGGWHDLFLRGTLAGHAAVTDAAAGPAANAPDGDDAASTHANGSRLIVGPWSHAVSGGAFPQRDHGWRGGLDAVDLTAVHLRWFDRHLRGRADVAAEPPVRLFVMGAGRWRDATAWPLPETTWTSWHLGAEGTLTADPPEPDRADTYEYDPRDPVPTCGGATFLPGQEVGARTGPLDQRAVEERDDVLVYSTAPLEHDLEVIGPVELILHISSSAPDTDFTGKLVDVHPDGFAELLTDGILRTRWRDAPAARPAEPAPLTPTPGAPAPPPIGAAEPAPLVPGEIYELQIDLGATANRFRAGHRIRLEVSSSNFPRFDRNTNTGGDIATEHDGDAVVAVNTIHRGPTHPSRLRLPVIPG